MRDDRTRIRDMIQAITNIERYAVYGQERFVVDELVQTCIVHHLQILGEAANELTVDLRALSALTSSQMLFNVKT